MSGHLTINLESIFGLAALLLLLWRTEAGDDVTLRPRLKLDARDAIPMIAIALMICAAFWRAAHIPFVSDDYVLASMAQAFPGNYAALFTHGGGDGFFRPLGYLSMAWTWPWAGLDPIRWHMAGLTLHLANALLVYVLAGALGLSRGCCWLASALFAWHGANPEAVVWIASRFDLLAAFFALLALVAFIKLWEESSVPWGIVWGGGCAIAMGAGMLAKESAYGVPLAMLVYAALRPAAWSRRLRYLAPFFLVAGALFAYRWMLQGGIGGYVGAGGRPEALSLNLLTVAKSLGLRLWAVLFFPVNWAVPAGTWLGTAAILYAAVWVWILFALGGKRVRLLIPLGFAIAFALPAVQQLLIGADLEKSRLVYLPSAGFCLLVASAIGMIGANLQSGAGLAILAFNFAALMHNLTGWEDVAAKSKAFCEAAAKCSNPNLEGIPRSISGIYFFANGLPDCVRMERAAHPELLSKDSLHSCAAVNFPTASPGDR